MAAVPPVDGSWPAGSGALGAITLGSGGHGRAAEAVGPGPHKTAIPFRTWDRRFSACPRGQDWSQRVYQFGQTRRQRLAGT